MSDLLFAGSFFTGVYSSVLGNTWTSIVNGLTNLRVLCLMVDQTTVYAGTNGGGVFRTTDSGATWTAANNGLTHPNVNWLTTDDTYLYAGTAGGRIFVFDDHGASWMEFNSGLTNRYIYEILVEAGTIYIGTGRAGVWKRSVSEIAATPEIVFDNNAILIYPNPAISLVTLPFQKKNQERKAITLLNTTGQKIFEQVLEPNNSNEIQCHSFIPRHLFIAGANSKRTLF